WWSWELPVGRFREHRVSCSSSGTSASLQATAHPRGAEMKLVAMTLVGLGLTLLVAAEAGAQHSLAIDTCAPHRASFYGYAGHGGHAPLRHGRRVGSVQPFQGMINPRYAPRYYVAVVEEPAPYYTTRVYNNMPREIRERQEEIEIASD